MQREFEILKHPEKGCLAIKRGFSWPGFFFSWIWAFTKKMWLVGSVLLVFALVIGSLKFLGNPVFSWMLGIAFSVFVGFKGNYWRSRAAEKNGYSYVSTISANSSERAVSKFLKGETSITYGFSFPIPQIFQKTFAIVSLTWKAAFRYRLFWVLAALLIAAVVALPLLIKDDGTARGFTQILLTYTLGSITALLGIATLWLSCGTLARDIEDAQIQMVAVKPIARWQIWIGKWLGILAVDALLLAIAGASVFFLLQWRATRLAPEQQAILRNEVLVARASVKEILPDFRNDIENELQRRLQSSSVNSTNIPAIRKQIEEQIKAGIQSVPAGGYRPWRIDLGRAKNSLRDQPLFLRVKFFSAQSSVSGAFFAHWQVGNPETTRVWQSEPMSLAPETFHEFPIPANLFDTNGHLEIIFQNPNNVSLLFPLDEGLEVLYREGSFGLNFTRGLGIIFFWLALLAALGLAAASFLSFPVAAFVSLSVLIISLSSGTLTTVVEEGTILGVDHESGMASGKSVLDTVMVPVFDLVLTWVVNPVQKFSPIDSLSTGRSITWTQLALAGTLIVLVFGAILAAIGMITLTFRELATAQGNS